MYFFPFSTTPRKKNFHHSRAALAAAFTTEDPSLGGCEDVGEPPNPAEENTGGGPSTVVV